MDSPHPIVTHEEWLRARAQLLLREKEFTRSRDQLSEQRRALPWERVDKTYTFEGSAGPQRLDELFEGKSQLAVYHFMYGPDEGQRPCKSCSFWADSFNGVVVHLAQRDVRMVAISRAPLPKLQAFAQRMQWTFPWYSSQGSEFNFDFGASFRADQVSDKQLSYNFDTQPAQNSEMPGLSVFYRDPSGQVFHTYSAYSRGIDALNTAYNYLDVMPKGRDEAGLPYPMAWLRYHDEY